MSTSNPDQAVPDDITDVLAGIWRELLDVSAVGPHDDFIALGGHSIAAMQLQFRLFDVFGVEVAMHLLLENSRLGPMAQCLMRELAGPGPDASLTHDEIARLSDAEVEALLQEL